MKPKTKELLILFLIIIIAVVFRVWGLAGLELHSDAGHYAFRALGWFDYLGGTEQTTPIYWFGSIPSWANLSFHDHPPLVFFLQKISFWISGGSVFAALLPGVLAGLGTLLFLYFALKSAFGLAWARLGAMLYAVSSYAIWSGRVGYLEAVEVVFLTGSCFFFLQFWTTRQNQYLYWWGAFTGLALITKYTALFLLPAAGVFILWKGRKMLKNPDFWLAGFLLLIVLTPVIIYNVMVFVTRGHFDAAVSAMAGVQPDDFRLIAKRAGDAGWWQKASGVYGALLANISAPLFWLYLGSLMWLGVAILRRKADEFSQFLFLNMGFMWVLFGFAGSADRFLSIAVPFLVMSLAAASWAFWQKLRDKLWQSVFAAVLVGAIAFEFFYSIQTNLLLKPRLPSLDFYSASRFYNRGFAELDKFLAETFQTAKKSLRRPVSMKEISELTLTDPQLVFFDTRADWFSSMWHVSRFRFYYNAPIVNFKADWADADGKTIDTYEQFRRIGLPYMLLVVAKGDNIVYSGGAAYDAAMASFLQRIAASGIAPIRVIADYQGKPGFEIYRLTPDDLK